MITREQLSKELTVGSLRCRFFTSHNHVQDGKVFIIMHADFSQGTGYGTLRIFMNGRDYYPDPYEIFQNSVILNDWLKDAD